VAVPGEGHPEALKSLVLHTNTELEGVAVGYGPDAALAGPLAEERLIGRDPRGVVGLWQDLVGAIGRADPSGRGMRAAALLDIALWDLKSSELGEPLWRTLGAGPPAVPAHFSLRDPESEAAMVGRHAAGLVERYGFVSACLEVGSQGAEDEHRLAAVHAALAGRHAQPVLLVDADDRWTPARAINRIREFERRFDLACLRVSSSAWTVEECRQVSEQVFAAVTWRDAAGGNEEQFPPLREFGLDIVMLDPLWRGITGALQLADAAYGYELPVIVAATPGDIGAHLAAALPNVMSLEVDPGPGGAAELAGAVHVEGGRARVGECLGHGLRPALAGGSDA